MEKLKCPFCGDDLHNLKCANDDCGFGKNYSIVPVDTTAGLIEKVGHALRATGNVFLQTSTGNFVWKMGEGEFVCNCAKPSNNDVVQLALYIRREFNLTTDQWGANNARNVLAYIRTTPGVINEVDWAGDAPLLIEKDGHLVFPYNPKIKSSKFFGPPGRAYCYTGPAYTPKDHGGIVDDWINSFRIPSPEDGAILKQWIVGALLQMVCPSGRVPSLLFVGREGCNIGKTESAYMLADIMGDMSNITWSTKEDKRRDLSREMLGGNCRFLLIDNMASQKSGIIDEPKLAAYLSQDILRTKKLYGTGLVSCHKVNLDIITANSPILSPELLTRVVCVGLTNQAPKTVGWRSKWLEHKQEILEELMYKVITQWDIDKTYSAPDDFRYTSWYNIVGRAMGREPILYAPNSCIGSPLDIICELEMEGERISLSDLIQKIRMSNFMAAKLFKSQVIGVTEEILKPFLDRWSINFKLKESEGTTWVVKK